MIKDKLVNINKYKINDAFEIFKTKLSDIDNILKIEAPFKAIPLEYETKKFDLSKFENHKKFIDVHYIIKGEETVGLTPIERLIPNMEYDPENDYQLFDGGEVMETIVLTEGEFLLLFPGEAHITGGILKENIDEIKKIVFKIPVI